MGNLKLVVFICIATALCNFTTSEEDDTLIHRGNSSRRKFSFKKTSGNGDFSSRLSKLDEENLSFQASGMIMNKPNVSSNTQKQFLRRSEHDTFDHSPYQHSVNLDSFWMTPTANFTARKDIKKVDHSFTWPTWSSKKEIYRNNRNRKNRKYLDSYEDYLGLDSKYHEMADRKYIHEHEGFFFPIHLPSSHHEKDDHLIPLLLLLLLPLLLFAIIIPLNANLLSTLFLIMQNNGATTTAAQLAAASGRKKRHVSNPLLEDKIMEVLHKFGTMTDNF